MYNRSRQGPNSKETGYRRVMAFVLRYHDLDGLRATMKQAMRVAGIRTFALEVHKRESFICLQAHSQSNMKHRYLGRAWG